MQLRVLERVAEESLARRLEAQRLLDEVAHERRIPAQLALHLGVLDQEREPRRERSVTDGRVSGEGARELQGGLDGVAAGAGEEGVVVPGALGEAAAGGGCAALPAVAAPELAGAMERLLSDPAELAALAADVVLPRFRAPLSAIDRRAWPWLLAGALLIGVQAVIFVSTIARWGQAATSNVIYSSRGLWTIVLVWLAGGWLASREQAAGRLLVWRLAGAALMMSAVALVAA